MASQALRAPEPSFTHCMFYKPLQYCGSAQTPQCHFSFPCGVLAVPAHLPHTHCMAPGPVPGSRRDGPLLYCLHLRLFFCITWNYLALTTCKIFSNRKIIYNSSNIATLFLQSLIYLPIMYLSFYLCVCG